MNIKNSKTGRGSAFLLDNTIKTYIQSQGASQNPKKFFVPDYKAKNLGIKSNKNYFINFFGDL